MLAKFQAGVPVRLIVDPAQYTNITWPEYWLTHANIDKLWAAGVPIKQALHARRHAHEDAGDVDLRDQRLVELRAELAARSRLLRVGGDQAGDLPGDRGPRRHDVERHGGLRAAAADAAERGRPGEPGVGRDRRRADHVARVEHRGVGGQLRRLSRHDAVEHDAGRQRAGAAGAQPADHLLVDAVDAAAAGHDVLLEGRVAHQRDAARRRR